MAVMTPALSRTLAQAARRVRLLLAFRAGAVGLGAGAILSGVLLALLRLRVLGEPPEEILLLPPLLGLAAGVTAALLRRVTALDVARLTEQRLDLKERFSTALTLTSAGDDPLVRRQIADAEAHAARGIDLKTALPLSPPRPVWAALAVTLAVLLAWFVPTLPFFLSTQERTERAEVKREGERIVRVAKALEREAAGKKLPNTRQAAKQMNALGRELQRGSLNKQKALMKVAKLTQQMQKTQQAMAAATAPKSLPAAGKELQKALDGAKATPKDGAQKKTDALNAEGDAKNKQGDQSGTPAAQQAARKMQAAMQNGDVPSLAEELSKMAQMAQQGQPGDKQGREQMAKQLAALSQALKGTSFEKASEPLKQAAEAMKKGDMAEASRQLQEAARQVAEAQRKKEDAEGMRQVAQAMQQQQGEQAGGAGTEGETPGDSGEGEGQNDAFGKNGKPKEHKHEPGGT